MAEYTKVNSYVDLEATGAQTEALKKQVQDVIDKIKSVSSFEVKLMGAQSAKETIDGINQLGKAQTSLVSSTKQVEQGMRASARATLDAAKADKIAADAAEIGIHRFRNGALIESIPPALGDRMIGFGEIGILEDLALRRRPAID